MAENNKVQKSGPRMIYAIARSVAVVAAGFSLVICVLMIANYFQVQAVDPLDSPALQTLLQQLEENPSDEQLKDQIRSLDLLARKAYFTSKWQLKTGGFLMLCGVLLMLISLKIMSEFSKKDPDQNGFSDPSNFWTEIRQSRKWIITGGTGLVILSVILSAFTQSSIDQSGMPDAGASSPSQEEVLRNWTNFRGPGGNGHASAVNPPIDWNVEDGTHILWKTEVPKSGMSSPVVWDDRLFLTGADVSARQIYCFDTANGHLLWTHDAKGIPGSPSDNKLPNVTEDTGLAAPTVTTDGRLVVALFATGDLVCVNMTGDRVWAKNLGVPDNHYGHASSLISHEGLVFVQYDQNENSKLFAFEMHSGVLKWEMDRGPISWASPICIDNHGRMELILTNSESADSYDPQIGQLLWHVECLYGEVGPSAAYSEGMVFVANEYATATALKISDQSNAPEIAWEWDEYLPNASSPLATKDLLILATGDGIVNCLDAKTGKVRWEQDFDDGFYSSPILVNDRVYLIDLSGVMQIFRMDASFELLGSPALGEDSFSTPAFVGDRIYIRGVEHLFCIGN
ncbi:PQQ-binding-like beta-propeller repeat protein [candidate division KSB1 bacterium]|nr:PQQ-binding-like beta-propeller repeat protein [candidate division KSB1 bacterium]